MGPRDAAILFLLAAACGIVQDVEARYAPPGLNLFDAGQVVGGDNVWMSAAFDAKKDAVSAAQRIVRASQSVGGESPSQKASEGLFNGCNPLNSQRTAKTIRLMPQIVANVTSCIRNRCSVPAFRFLNCR